MACALKFDNVTFAYPTAEGAAGSAGPAAPVLCGASLEVAEGAFALVCGATGSGKSTLLRLAKPEVAPAGSLEGRIELFGSPVGELDPQESAAACGYVFQNPDAQIVCDSVWHEMALGLENLGVPEPVMRRRVAQTCNFFGMEPWFDAQTAELSGGQRQLLALAAALAMRPRLLLLDEPTSMLDPVAEKAFLGMLFAANRDLGVTVVVATHAPWTMAAYATCSFVVEDGRVRPALDGELAEPALAVDGRARAAAGLGAGTAVCGWGQGHAGERCALLAKDVWHRYRADARWVLRGLGLEVAPGEVRALVGANGSGKSTLLRVLAGVERAGRGRVKNQLAASQALLPQSPKALLSCATVREELMEWAGPSGAYGEAEVADALARLGLSGRADRHPYDLSGGQQQLLALEKLMLVRPRLLLLDEPTKGLDLAARTAVAARVAAAAGEGCTVLVATHDLAFARAVADSVSLLFNGELACTLGAAEYFADAWA